STVRLEEIMKVKPDYVYAALRTGITGSYTQLTDENIIFLKRLNAYGCKILAGFGLRDSHQVALLQPYAHALVVGSFFVNNLTDCIYGEQKPIYETLKKAIESLQVVTVT
ncbi:MAG: tryptophan synthase subunit alpha, partial [Spirochaetota bacterium]